MTVSICVQPVIGSQLKSWLCTEEFRVLILDCRSFLCYNSRHIVNACNVHCPLLLKRRSNGPLPLDHLVPCGEARNRLLAGFYEAVVVYDDDSTVVSKTENQANISWVLETLFQGPFLQLSTKTYFLVGGFNQFSLDCPTLCVTPPNPSSSAMQSPPAAPVKRSPPPVLKLTESRNCKTPSATTSPRSPRPPLLRRGPALSLPNLKCINVNQDFDYKASLTPSPHTPALPVPSGCQTVPAGPAYECNGLVPLLPHLYLGSNFHASRLSVLEEHGITAVLNVSRLPNYFPTCFRYMQIPVDDSTDADLLPWFEEATNFIESVQRNNGRVLVHCHAGISRSATICLAYLMKVRQIRLEEAFEFVSSVRTVISPNLAFMLQLLRYENELISSRKQGTNDNSSSCSLAGNGGHANNTFPTNSNSNANSNVNSNVNCDLNSTSSPLSSPSPCTSVEKVGATRQLSLGSSPLLVKRMARSVSLPCTRSQTTSPTGTPSRKQTLAFNFNLPVLPKSGVHSCALECSDLSPCPSPIFSPM
ncbi:dual specificity protein phosphatase 1-B-like [Diadema antillarum]|uniref:dual specificity protein phosphatase 1-B-like n=1 Tax=Diadema antillarum TaxID=105358 RepID=UPI003A88BB23